MDIEKNLNKKEQKAIEEAVRILRQKFQATQIILFGSKVDGSYNKESDIDLLITLPKSVDTNLRHIISDLLFEINIKYAANLSGIVLSNDEWNKGLFSLLPFHEKIESEGIRL